jgi:hypothetical protein
LKSAQARAFQENREYLLPARFDDTEIPGLLPQIAYVDLQSMDPQAPAELIYQKICSDGPVRQPVTQQIDPGLEKELADAVVLAEDYLAPIGLGMAEPIAALVRRSFENVGTIPKLQLAAPYMRNPKAPYRVVGYLACQVAAERGQDVGAWALDLIACLMREHREALEHRETRPLWQLLVCIDYAMRSKLFAI